MARRMAGRALAARRRGRIWLLALLVAGGLLGLLLLAATSAYQLAASRYAEEAQRLRGDLAAAREANRRLTERTAAAEQRGAMSVARAAQIERALQAREPKGAAAELLRLVESRLAEGVPAERLAFVVAQAAPERRCEDRTETRRVQPRTPLDTSSVANATFAESKVTVTARGATAPTASGQADAAFDPARPVELRFVKIGGEVETASGVLPLGHAFVMGDRELRFIARLADRQSGSIEVSLQICAYP
jgi:hypothetical protein